MQVNKFEIKPGFLIYFALLLLLLPLRWVFAWFIAIGIHEICHYIPLKLFHIKIIRLSVEHTGAFMQTDSMLPWQELVTAACGPIGGLLLLLLRQWFPMISACAIIHTGFNLLPIYPFDGGRILRAFIQILQSSENR